MIKKIYFYFSDFYGTKKPGWVSLHQLAVSIFQDPPYSRRGNDPADPQMCSKIQALWEAEVNQKMYPAHQISFVNFQISFANCLCLLLMGYCTLLLNCKEWHLSFLLPLSILLQTNTYNVRLIVFPKLKDPYPYRLILKAIPHTLLMSSCSCISFFEMSEQNYILLKQQAAGLGNDQVFFLVPIPFLKMPNPCFPF